MPNWLIPMAYTAVSLAGGLILPRLEHAYLPAYSHAVSLTSAQAFFSAVSSGMMALTGIVFAIAFVVVQFSALAYSPRVVVVFVGSPTLYHTLGIFFATFCYSLVALLWSDRGGSGTVPLFSAMLVAVLLIASLLVFAWLIQSINNLQIHNVLRRIGAEGRTVVRQMFPRLADAADGIPLDAEAASDPGLASQTLIYVGEPRVVARFDAVALVRLAQAADALIILECGVGDTVVEDTVLLRVYGPALPIPEQALRRTIRLAATRTFEQDPKYPIRLLVDVAIRALSPAVNDPTTAVQALDQIEDLLRRLGNRQLEAGYARDASGAIRVRFPVPAWQDYLALSFDEIRQYGAGSVQVGRRLRAALAGLFETVPVEDRRAAVARYLEHLESGVKRSSLDAADQATASLEDRQGLGLPRKRAAPKAPAAGPEVPRPVPAGP